MSLECAQACTDLAVRAGYFCANSSDEMIENMSYSLQASLIDEVTRPVSLRFRKAFTIMRGINQLE
jgi:hypothetical protein